MNENTHRNSDKNSFVNPRNSEIIPEAITTPKMIQSVIFKPMASTVL